MPPPSQCRLELVNLHEADQYAEIQRQRQICGWDYSAQVLQKWKDKQREKLKSLFWITVTIEPGNDNDDKPIRAGHIALDAYCDPPELDTARPDKSVLAITSFFILPEYRTLGLGRRVMRMVEELAVVEPHGSRRCRFLALTALSKRYVYDEGPEWRGLWAKLGMQPPSFSIQEWYEKMGYVRWKDEPLYEERALDGSVVRLWEACMRKEVRASN